MCVYHLEGPSTNRGWFESYGYSWTGRVGAGPPTWGAEPGQLTALGGHEAGALHRRPPAQRGLVLLSVSAGSSNARRKALGQAGGTCFCTWGQGPSGAHTHATDRLEF